MQAEHLLYNCEGWERLIVDSWLLCAEFQYQLSVNYITNQLQWINYINLITSTQISPVNQRMVIYQPLVMM